MREDADAARRPLPQETIRRKRDGGSLAAAEIDAFVSGALAGRVAPEQVAAFLMAAFLRGLDRDETVALTETMMRSGSRLSWSGLDGPVLDKHSTGGVGDVVSLMLAPAVAACGAFVPMISGRGLGHSGGTLDKLEAIPGYEISPSPERFRKVVAEIGCAIIGQTTDLAPADRLLYGIRDVTATVESIPLITASILSKKLSAGLGRLVMDVKTGSGAFMVDLDDARALARSLVEVAAGAGLPTSALITDMDQPLARAAGNSLEIRTAVDYLTGTVRDARLHAVVLALGSEMLRLGGLVASRAEGQVRIERALSGGAAAECFGRMVAALGGPSDLLDHVEDILPRAPVCRPVNADKAGVVTNIETRAVGLAVVSLGGGRTRASDAVDPRVGFSALLPVGTVVAADTPLGFVHAATLDAAEQAAVSLRKAYGIADVAPVERHPVIEIMEAAS
ncbi:thymidine phosphorylase [Lichenifustis flavocetrariae]|uniref:Thymidine phosphorylase n=1 Tax=Lichenifustis flavocetrariae TaxID=2949735 RepID=A0AA42CHM2_9HYPH|nr:thymidine phosphorylase [Lichenifustis flavocetrariae]MCW6507414.1 thymidine phosphorylase [Lichenifustis flavocetrariae]